MSETLDVLLRIMGKATKYAQGDDVNYEGLAEVYENAIYKELADLTTPTNQTKEEV